mmetsp:Transcript_16113/g.41070  ORF Transcript_16113/g.41070 Transcript_16113/m.41070 type:complete len:405 (+) Transcript_16113:479-1693(+)
MRVPALWHKAAVHHIGAQAELVGRLCTRVGGEAEHLVRVLGDGKVGPGKLRDKLVAHRDVGREEEARLAAKEPQLRQHRHRDEGRRARDGGRLLGLLLLVRVDLLVERVRGELVRVQRHRLLNVVEGEAHQDGGKHDDKLQQEGGERVPRAAPRRPIVLERARGHRRRHVEEHGREAEYHLPEVEAQQAAEHRRGPVGPAAEDHHLARRQARLLEHVPDRAHVGRVGRDERADRRLRAHALTKDLLLPDVSDELHDVAERRGPDERAHDGAGGLGRLDHRRHEQHATGEVDGRAGDGGVEEHQLAKYEEDERRRRPVQPQLKLEQVDERREHEVRERDHVPREHPAKRDRPEAHPRQRVHPRPLRHRRKLPRDVRREQQLRGLRRQIAPKAALVRQHAHPLVDE